MAEGGTPAERGVNDSPAPTGATGQGQATGVADTAVPAAAERGKGPRQVRTGDVLGRYEVGDELGEGGMATVFRARDRELRRDVAIKVLFPHLARRPEIVRRFHREARAAAGLEHPNILRIYDVGGGEGEEPPFIVMELIRGRTLLQELELRGAMLSELAACVGAVLADALSAAHAAGIIHRDVKPANVLLAANGRVLLADFGVARLETEDSLVTRTGALLGTPAYMSPEQAIGDLATARSDLYSLGATLYQLASGALPYAGTQAKVMSAIAAGACVPAVRRRPACGGELSRLIERAMAKEPADRPASATAVASELRSLASAGGLGDPAEELAAYFEDRDAFLARRTPTVVAALVAAARAALAADKLPRAMALADRASALAPDDADVAAVIAAITDGGRASRRRRGLAIAVVVVGVAVAGGAYAWRGPTGATPAGSAGEAMVASGAATVEPTRGSATSASAVPAPSAAMSSAMPESTAAATPGSAATVAAAPKPEPRRATGSARPRIDAPTPRIDAPTPRVDVPAPTPPVAAPTPPVETAPVVEPPARGHIVVRNDLWCSVWIDGVDRGNHRNEPLEVPAGHHTVRCVNPAGSWTQEAQVAPGQTAVLTGSLLRELAITLDTEATLDGRAYPRGAVVRLKPGNVEVVAGGKKKFMTFRETCTLREVPELGCYR